MARKVGWKVASALAGALVIPAAARGDDAVPGGWSIEVGYQGLGPISAPASIYGPAQLWPVVTPQAAARPRTTNALGPLGQAIRKTAVPKGRRPR